MGLHRGGPPALELRRGDWVYVHPDEPGAPREVRGLAGIVSETGRGRVKVAFRGTEVEWTMEVDARILRLDRRRRDRPPAEWTGHDLAATG